MPKKLFALLTIAFFVLRTNAQNILPFGTENCIKDEYCLDCGDVKAELDTNKLNSLLSHLNTLHNYKDIKEKILFQVIVDSFGKACVQSHSAFPLLIPRSRIINALENFTGYLPASSNGKKLYKNSILIAAEIDNKVTSMSLERFDIKKFSDKFEFAVRPEVYSEYEYKNKNLKKYKIKAWDKNNSTLPANFCRQLSCNKKDNILVTVNCQLVIYNNNSTGQPENRFEYDESMKVCDCIAYDNHHNRWFATDTKLYNPESKKVVELDSTITGFASWNGTNYNPQTKEQFFFTKKGLFIFDGKDWTALVKEIANQLPSNEIRFAKRDSKGRLWIGTYEGTVMIDENKEIGVNQNTDFVKGKCVSDLVEDNAGNIYLGLSTIIKRENHNKLSEKSLVIFYPDGITKLLTPNNSGLPAKSIEKIIYDKIENALWITTLTSGLVRYNLKDDTWENYHSENSAIPTSAINDITIDSKGNIFLATAVGLVEMHKKQ